MIKEANLSNIKFYTTLGIKKPYFYDILSGKVNPPPPERQFAMLKLLNPTEEQRNLFFDLAAQERNEVPADIAEILKDKELCSELRKNINYKKILKNGDCKNEFHNHILWIEPIPSTLPGQNLPGTKILLTWIMQVEFLPKNGCRPASADNQAILSPFSFSLSINSLGENPNFFLKHVLKYFGSLNPEA